MSGARELWGGGMVPDKGKESHKQQTIAGHVKDFDMHICLKTRKSSLKCYKQKNDRIRFAF